MEFSADVQSLLKLVVGSIYTKKEIFLRELISNASDASDRFRCVLLMNSEMPLEELRIVVSFSKDSAEIIVTDFGIGMDKEDLISNLGTIANSGTKKFLASTPDIQLIGQFGVGFYSVFMVAKEVTVLSTKYNSKTTWRWHSDGQKAFTLTPHDVLLPRGTSVILKLQPSACEFLDKHKLRHIIKTYSDYIPIPILLSSDKTEIVNVRVPLWSIDEKDITEMEYFEFYRHVSFLPDEPQLRIHRKVESECNFTMLLFIPSTKPHDLFHPDIKIRAKLYVKRVLVLDEATELIPSYMRFLRGIIDTDELPLNVSREGTQENIAASKIRKSIVRNVLEAIGKLPYEQFVKFWKNFGEVLKEGLCQSSFEDKGKLLAVSRFYSAQSGDELITLQDYIDKMQKGQQQIYFIGGATLPVLKNNPKSSGFTSKGIDVLLLADHIDDYWSTLIKEYKGFQIRSISEEGVEPELLAEETLIPTNKVLLSYIAKYLGTKVRDVKWTHKLTDSPACLSHWQGGMNARMESILVEQKQLKKRSPKVLEVNLDHWMLRLIGNWIETGNQVATDDLIDYIFYRACLIDGEPIEAPQVFVQKLDSFVAKAIELIQ